MLLSCSDSDLKNRLGFLSEFHAHSLLCENARHVQLILGEFVAAYQHRHPKPVIETEVPQPDGRPGGSPGALHSIAFAAICGDRLIIVGDTHGQLADVRKAFTDALLTDFQPDIRYFTSCTTLDLRLQTTGLKQSWLLCKKLSVNDGQVSL